MMPSELRPLANQLLESMESVLQGQITPQQGSALAALTNSLIRVIETGILETRLKRIEETVSNEHQQKT